MKRSITACLLPVLASLALAAASAAQSYPPPPPPDDSAYGDQGYPDQQPYYQPPPDGSYEDQTYDDQAYPDQTAYDNQYGDQPGNQGPVDESVFYGELSSYGRWFQRGSYGWVWEPTRVAVGWRPYTQGHWVDTDYGWTWVSDEPWGWATYHYGRWTLDPEYGWLWVPGTEWGPAWVSFQEGNGYIGWAPLPPSIGFRAGFGIQIGGLSLSAEINPLAYSFVPARSFLSERIAVEIAPPARNVTFIRGSRNITNIRVENDRVVNRSIPEERIQEVTGRPVHRYRLNEVRNPAQGRVSRVQGDQVTIFRPAPTLAQARPDNTPPAAIQRRQRLVQQRQGGQAPPQAGQPQPGRAPQAPQPVPQLSGADLNRKHQVEQQQLQARQNAERSRLQQEHQQQQANQQTRGRAPDLPAQQQSEQRALQDQQKREQQLLEARHQRERQATQANQNRPPGQQGRPAQAQQQNQPRETQQRRNREQERAREEQQQRDKQPPPPPPLR